MKKLVFLLALTAGLVSCTKENFERNPTETVSTETNIEKNSDKKSKVKLDVVLVSSEVRTVQVSLNEDTEDVLALTFTITAKHGDASVDEIPVRITSTGNVNSVIQQARLLMNGEERGNAEPVNGIANFDDLDMYLLKNEPKTFTVLYDLKELQGNYPEGTMVTTKVIANGIKAEDNNGDDIKPVHINLSGDPQTIELRTYGLIITPVSTTAVSSIDPSQLLFTVKVKATAFGSDMFVGQSVAYYTGWPPSGFWWVLEKSTSPNNPVTTLTQMVNVASDAPVEGNAFRIDEGVARTFTVTAYVSGIPPDGFYRMRLTQIRSFPIVAMTTGMIINHLVPRNNYRTPFAYFSL